MGRTDGCNCVREKERETLERKRKKKKGHGHTSASSNNTSNRTLRAEPLVKEEETETGGVDGVQRVDDGGALCLDAALPY